MNIKIMDPIPEDLILATFPFGSRVYGMHTKDSDYDYIKILKKSAGELILQYQDNWQVSLNMISGAVTSVKQNDFTYVDLLHFIQLATTGGNTGMYEVSLLPEFQARYGKLDHDVYATAKAYLGLAKRDTHYPERHRHVTRCIWMAQVLMAGQTPDLTQVKYIPEDGASVEMNRELIQALRIQLNKQFLKT